MRNMRLDYFAAAPPACSNSMQSKIRKNLQATASAAGELRRAMVLGHRPEPLMVSSGCSLAMKRGAHLNGPDDGTISPWAVIASLPFAPEIVLPMIRYFVNDINLEQGEPYSFKASFNPSYPAKSGREVGWVSPCNYGLNQGPIVLMIENHRSGLLWRLMRQCPYIVAGLRRAGFSGGWL